MDRSQTYSLFMATDVACRILGVDPKVMLETAGLGRLAHGRTEAAGDGGAVFRLLEHDGGAVAAPRLCAPPRCRDLPRAGDPGLFHAVLRARHGNRPDASGAVQVAARPDAHAGVLGWRAVATGIRQRRCPRAHAAEPWRAATCGRGREHSRGGGPSGLPGCSGLRWIGGGAAT